VTESKEMSVVEESDKEECHRVRRGECDFCY